MSKNEEMNYQTDYKLEDKREPLSFIKLESGEEYDLKVVGAGSGSLCYRAVQKATKNAFLLKEFYPLSISKRENGVARCAHPTHQNNYNKFLNRFSVKQPQLLLAFQASDHNYFLEGDLIEDQLGVFIRFRDRNGDVLAKQAPGDGKKDLSTFVTALKYAKDLLCDVLTLREANLVHLDIKPDNIFILKVKNGDQATIFDFDSAMAAAEISEEYLSTSGGWYSMRELMENQDNPHFWQSVDIKAVCKVLSCMLIGDYRVESAFPDHREQIARYRERFYKSYGTNLESEWLYNRIERILKERICNAQYNESTAAELYDAKKLRDTLEELISAVEMTELSPESIRFASIKFLESDWIRTRFNELYTTYQEMYDQIDKAILPDIQAGEEVYKNEWMGKSKDARSLPFHKIMERKPSQRILYIGDSGSGKSTTLMEYWVSSLMNKDTDYVIYLPARLLPFGTFKDYLPNLIKALYFNFGTVSVEDIRLFLENKRGIILLIDGINELYDEKESGLKIETNDLKNNVCLVVSEIIDSPKNKQESFGESYYKISNLELSTGIMLSRFPEVAQYSFLLDILKSPMMFSLFSALYQKEECKEKLLDITTSAGLMALFWDKLLTDKLNDRSNSVDQKKASITTRVAEVANYQIILQAFDDFQKRYANYSKQSIKDISILFIKNFFNKQFSYGIDPYHIEKELRKDFLYDIGRLQNVDPYHIEKELRKDNLLCDIGRLQNIVSIEPLSIVHDIWRAYFAAIYLSKALSEEITINNVQDKFGHYLITDDTAKMIGEICGISCQSGWDRERPKYETIVKNVKYLKDRVIKENIISNLTRIIVVAVKGDLSGMSFLIYKKTISQLNGSNYLKYFMPPLGIEYLKKGALQSCHALEKVVLPDSVKKIGENAFEFCISLREVVLPSNIRMIEENTFKWCEKLTKIELPDSIIEIHDDAFLGCKRLTNIDFPKALKVIKESSFWQCSSIVQIKLPPRLKKIEFSVFYECENLSKITLPNHLKAIGPSAFYNCRKLTNISIPNHLKAIGPYAFYNCRKLTNINIPKNTNSIRSCAFCGCAITKIVLPKKIKKITAGAFAGINNLDIVIPKKLQKRFVIVDDKFFCSINKTGVDLLQITKNNSETVSLPQEIDTLLGGSIYKIDCKKMVIHKNIKIIEASAFWQCGIEAFIVDKDNAFYQSIDGVLYGKDGSQLIAYPAKKEGIFFEIPKEVHNISEYFYLNSNVKILKLNSFLKIKGDTQLLGIIGTEAYQNLSQPYFYILDKEEKEFLGIESEQLHPACAIFPKEINMLNLLVLLDNIRREGYIDLFDYHLTYIFFAMEPACLCLNFLNDSNKFDEDMVSYIKHNGLAKMIFVPDESLGKYKDKWSCDKKTIFEKYKYDENSDFAVVSGFADKMINNIQPLSRLADSIGVSTQELYQAFYENYNIEILEKLKERLKLKEE